MMFTVMQRGISGVLFDIDWLASKLTYLKMCFAVGDLKKRAGLFDEFDTVNSNLEHIALQQ